jgi:hypothetical protein
VRYIKKLNPETGVELLIPDFNGEPALLEQVFESRPEVLAHNVETVPRIFRRIRPAFRYVRSLAVLTVARDYGLVTKSNLILGMGETPDEVRTALKDLLDAGCDIVTIPSTCGRRCAITRSSWSGPRSSSSAAFAEGSASPGCWPDRWCGRRTERAASTAQAAGSRVLGTHPYPDVMAKTETRPPSRPPKPRPRPPEGRIQAAPQPAVAGVPDQRKRTNGCCIHDRRASGSWRPPVAGVFAGGFTMATLIPLGVVLGAGGSSSRPPAQSRCTAGRGPAGAAAWALENCEARAGHPRRRGDRTSRRGAPGDRQARVIFVGEGSAARVKPLLAQRRSAPPGWSVTS